MTHNLWMRFEGNSDWYIYKKIPNGDHPNSGIVIKIIEDCGVFDDGGVLPPADCIRQLSDVEVVTLVIKGVLTTADIDKANSYLNPNSISISKKDVFV